MSEPKPKARLESPLTSACAFCHRTDAGEGVVVRRDGVTLMTAHVRCLKETCAVGGNTATLDLAAVVALPNMALEWHHNLSQLTAARALAKVLTDVSFLHPSGGGSETVLRSDARPSVIARTGWFGGWCAVCETANWASTGVVVTDASGGRVHVHKCCLTPEYWEGADNVYAVMRINLRKAMSMADAEAALELIDEAVPASRMLAARNRYFEDAARRQATRDAAAPG